MQRLLQSTRLLTLTAPGEPARRASHWVADGLLERLTDGVVFVALGPYGDPRWSHPQSCKHYPSPMMGGSQ